MFSSHIILQFLVSSKTLSASLRVLCLHSSCILPQVFCKKEILVLVYDRRRDLTPFFMNSIINSHLNNLNYDSKVAKCCLRTSVFYEQGVQVRKTCVRGFIKTRFLYQNRLQEIARFLAKQANTEREKSVG